MKKEKANGRKNGEIRAQQMIEVAKMYYLDGLHQEEIARQTYMSRSNISRILARCVETGIVQITIQDSRTLHPQLAATIRNAFNLREVFICETSSDQTKTYHNMGEMLSEYLTEELQNGMLLGVTNGAVNYHLARSLKRLNMTQADAIQMMGGSINSNVSQDGLMVTEAFARKLNGRSFVLQAPLMTKSKQLKQLILTEQICSKVIEKYKNIDIALIEIQPLSVLISPQLRHPWLSPADALQLSQLNAKASICGLYFDADGKPCNAGINDRIIAIDYDCLKTLPCKVGTAVGQKKHEAVLSIINSGLIDILAIDESLAFTLGQVIDAEGVKLK